MPSTLATVATSAADLAGAFVGLGDMVPTAVMGFGAGLAAAVAALRQRRALRVSATTGKEGMSFEVDLSAPAALAAPAIIRPREVQVGAHVVIDDEGVSVPREQVPAVFGHRSCSWTTARDYALRSCAAVEIVPDRGGMAVHWWPGRASHQALASAAEHLAVLPAGAPVYVEPWLDGWLIDRRRSPAEAIERLYRWSTVPELAGRWDAQEIEADSRPEVRAAVETWRTARSRLTASAARHQGLARRSIILDPQDSLWRLLWVGLQPAGVLGMDWAQRAIGQPDDGTPDQAYADAARAAYQHALTTGRPRLDLVRASFVREGVRLALAYHRLLQPWVRGDGRPALSVTSYIDGDVAWQLSR